MGNQSFVQQLLNSPNPLTRYGFALVIVFGPLYLLSSSGMSWPWTIALIILAGIFLKKVGEEKAMFT